MMKWTVKILIELMKVSGDMKNNKTRQKVVYNPMFAHEIFMKPGSIEAIQKAKGYKNDSDMARNLGITRQYLSALKARKSGVSHTVIIRLAILLGNVHNNWWIFFEIAPSTKIKTNNHPAFNLHKANGQIPYSEFSPMAQHRRIDNPVETSRNNDEFVS